jgi:hypothetical protein
MSNSDRARQIGTVSPQRDVHVRSAKSVGASDRRRHPVFAASQFAIRATASCMSAVEPA